MYLDPQSKSSLHTLLLAVRIKKSLRERKNVHVCELQAHAQLTTGTYIRMRKLYMLCCIWTILASGAGGERASEQASKRVCKEQDKGYTGCIVVGLEEAGGGWWGGWSVVLVV